MVIIKLWIYVEMKKKIYKRLIKIKVLWYVIILVLKIGDFEMIMSIIVK